MNYSRRFCIIALMSFMSLGTMTNAQSVGNDSPEIKPRMGILSEEVLRARLAAAGYGEIQSIKREERYFIVEAIRDGKIVRVKVDAATGQISEENR